MKKEVLLKGIYNSLDNFFVEFVFLECLYTGKFENRVISFGALVPEFIFYFYVKEVDEDLEEHVQEMLHEVLSEFGYKHNLDIHHFFITDLEEYKKLLQKDNFECIYVNPDFKDCCNCHPVYWDRIMFFYNDLMTGNKCKEFYEKNKDE